MLAVPVTSMLGLHLSMLGFCSVVCFGVYDYVFNGFHISCMITFCLVYLLASMPGALLTMCIQLDC